MSDTANKLALLSVLRSQPEALGLPEVLALLPAEFAERSVRRWLADLIAEGRVVKTGQKRGTRYRLGAAAEAPGTAPRTAPDQPQQRVAVQFSQEAEDAIGHVRQPIFERRPVAYNQQWLGAYQPNRTAYFLPEERQRLAVEGRRAPIGDPAGTYAKRIYDRLLIDLSYHSSRLEGNTYSLLDTERLLLEGASAAGKLSEETVMILNHKEAIRHLVEQSLRRDIDSNEILTLHYLLADALVATEHAGSVRDHGVRVGGSTYIPYEDKPRLEKQLGVLADKAAAIQDPFEQSLFLLIHIAYLQAFADVNKRTSRLCANIPLLRHNLVPFSCNAIEKDDYATAIVAIYELNEPRPLAELYVASYLRTCAEYDATVEASGFDEVRVRFREPRREAIRQIVLEGIVGGALAGRIEEVAERIPEAHRERFVENLQEDLAALSPARIAGIGITQRQLAAWLAARQRQ